MASSLAGLIAPPRIAFVAVAISSSGSGISLKDFRMVSTWAEIVAAAEVFCLAEFKQSRTDFGLDCCTDFASDRGLTQSEYVAEYGNDADNDDWFLDTMSAHSFLVGTRDSAGNLTVRGPSAVRRMMEE